ncbi:YitT family protein [Clostridium perfringens]|uniref:YitT family protein n=1 Tax=Clostridium perfringens TaxID=1502 RepID=UPI0039062AC8
MLVGVAIGIALNHDCATGGTDLIALLIQHFIKIFKVPIILLFLDGFVVLASGIISKNILIAVFSFISLMVIIQTIKYLTTTKES